MKLAKSGQVGQKKEEEKRCEKKRGNGRDMTTS